MVEGLDALLEDQDTVDTVGLRSSLHELISNQYGKGRLTFQEKIKPRVFRVHFDLGTDVLVLILKCMKRSVARCNELVARRWLPAAGLAEMCPQLLGSAGTRDGVWMWHVYGDLGPYSLAEDQTSPERVAPAVRLIAKLHKQFIGHPYMAEFRLRGGDLGVPFIESNLKDATLALEAIAKHPKDITSDWAIVDKLLGRLSAIHDELPFSLQMMKEFAGPETLLHGDLWLENVFVLPDGRAKLIDWDHVGAGPLVYDLSTFILRFPPAQRSELLEQYQEVLKPTGWKIPAQQELNTIFETCEFARFACLAIWPAIALWDNDAPWALEQLKEIDRWFETWEAVLPQA